LVLQWIDLDSSLYLAKSTVVRQLTIHYICENRNKVGELRGKFGAIR
jgi:hypothetical protein